MPTKQKELLVFFLSLSVVILVPKRRGEGFLLTPLGHHACPLSDLAFQIGFDIFGLDGMLEVQTGYPGSVLDIAKRQELLEMTVQPISDLLGFPYRVVEHDEFWRNHPATTKLKR